MQRGEYLYGTVKAEWAAANPVLKDKNDEAYKLITWLQTHPVTHPMRGGILYLSGVVRQFRCKERDFNRINKSLTAMRFNEGLMKEALGKMEHT